MPTLTVPRPATTLLCEEERLQCPDQPDQRGDYADREERERECEREQGGDIASARGQGHALLTFQPR